MQIVLDQNNIAEMIINKTSGIFGDKIGVFGKVFGCWHKKMSRPFTNRKGSYRSCLDCGARRPFDPNSFITYGAFYYPPKISRTNSFSE